MRLPLDKLWPSAYRWLLVLHLDHLLEFKSKIRVMLLLSCIISGGYSVAWLMDIIQLSCFTNTPWKEEGIGRWTCIFYFFGGIALAFMFQHSAMALAYYDETGEELREKKERFLDEMQKQTGHVLARATNQAQRLCGMLSSDLGDKVNEHVFRMRRILVMLSRHEEPEAKHIYDNLATQMAYHLHNLRQPALLHFEKLAKLSGQTQALMDTLKHARHQSMVELLTGQTMGLPRTATFLSDGEDRALTALEEMVKTKRTLHDALCFGCCHPHSKQKALRRSSSSVDTAFNVPTESDLQEYCAQVPPEIQQSHPEKVVLQPLRLVLKWFEKIEPKQDAMGSRALAAASPVLQGAQNAGDQVKNVVTHLRESSFYRCILFGILCSIGLFAFYTHMLGVCWHVLKEGECHGQLIFQCSMALVRKLFGMFAMACYTCSLSVVLWNVEHLDMVMQVQEEIHEIEDFKRQIDHLNAHDLTEEDSSVSMIQSVEKALQEQKTLVAAFFNSAWGESVPLSTYDQLALDLESALRPHRGMFPGNLLSSGKREAYTRLPDESLSLDPSATHAARQERAALAEW